MALEYLRSLRCGHDAMPCLRHRRFRVLFDICAPWVQHMVVKHVSITYCWGEVHKLQSTMVKDQSTVAEHQRATAKQQSTTVKHQSTSMNHQLTSHDDEAPTYCSEAPIYNSEALIYYREHQAVWNQVPAVKDSISSLCLQPLMPCFAPKLSFE